MQQEPFRRLSANIQQQSVKLSNVSSNLEENFTIEFDNPNLKEWVSLIKTTTLQITR